MYDKLKFKIDGIEHSLDLSDLKLSEDGITNALCRQPGLYANVHRLYVKAKCALDLATENISIVKAVVDERIRPQMGAKPTEASIKQAIARDKDVIEANQTYLEAKETESLLAGILVAFAQRKDCAIALGHLVRREMENSKGHSV